MKLKDVRWSFLSKKGLFKILLTMKFAILFLMLTTSQIFGSAYSQTVRLSLNLKDASVTEVFAAIEDQSEFKFLYHDALLEGEKSRNIQFKDKTIEEVLNQLFFESNNTFSVLENNLVVITPKETEIKQERIITGTISDEKGAPMPGVNVTIKDTTVGTVTDGAGYFSIAARSGDILQFSFIGYLTEEVEVTSQSNINLQLAPSIESLDEVVVIGYGTVKKSDLTGSVASIKEAELSATPVTSALEALQGKITGLDLTRNSGSASSGVKINVRGTRSITASNFPYILVDGVPYENFLDDEKTESLIDINPNDIASIEVLKDASSTAIYGAKGANGVILITTKRGTADKIKVSLNGYIGSNTVAGLPEFESPEEYIQHRREAYRTAGQWSSPEDDGRVFERLDWLEEEKFVDWYDLLIRKGSLQNYQFNISGGSEKTTYSFSADMRDEKGILKLDNYRKYGIRTSVDHQIAKWLKAGVSLQYSRGVREKRNNPLGRAVISPIAEAYDSLGNIVRYPLDDGRNVSPIADEVPGVYENKFYTNRFFSSNYLELEIIEGLVLKSTLGLNISNEFEGLFADQWSLDRQGEPSRAYIDITDRSYIQSETYVTFNKEIGIHNFSIVGGQSISKDIEKNVREEATNLLSKTQLYYNLYASDLEQATIQSGYVQQQLLSFFGRMNYILADRFLFTFTFRSDGASVLAEGHKRQNFPSGAFAIKMQEFSFMKSLTAISELKPRISYGTSGNYSVDPYSTAAKLGATMYSWDESPATGYYLRTIGVKDLKWETTRTLNVGLDFGLLNNRVYGSIDIYKQNTTDLLLENRAPSFSGYFSVIDNIGETENKGIEAMINSTNISTASGFKWSTGFTISHNKEEIVKLNKDVLEDINNGWFVGHPVDVHYDYKKIGIWQRPDSALAVLYGYRPGEIRMQDLDNDTAISADDKQILGTPRPKVTFGLNNRFEYKGFDLSVFVFARLGQMIHSSAHAHFDFEGLTKSIKCDYWLPDNPTNEYPRPDRRKPHFIQANVLGYKDGSFVKVRDITFGYTLPSKLTSRIQLSRLRIYSTMKNYFTFSEITPYDPERGGSLSEPMTKQWIFGINVEF